jgi:hypothetical protein
MHINLIGNIGGNGSGKMNMLLSSGQPRESIM